ncbi:hypothetical protein LPM83_07850 [Klebsiella pneumoniae]|nr:hypothetical protein [Klebsiella pneumoniae]MCF0472351.1 hypothetical protein [Klebsiella pneumoniae]MCF0493578.1 hypothetical protein [Klebsiella pneumoniae]MCF0521388.1 hypothetical protein [Klebsiella pneumoniae]MCF0570170.1 hypothetical protein [Klebsiella pneumoniae]MCF0585948.1 hypothetical protein [Klebsiella pneumoniae]
MTKSTITREESIQAVFDLKVGYRLGFADIEILKRVARMALAAMDSEPVALDYLQGHKDGLEWAALLAEANHPETGDWLYDDPIELSKAIRKGPDMPPVQPVADSEPVAWTWHYREQWHVTNDERRAEFVAKDGDVAVLPLYRHAQPAPKVMQSESAIADCDPEVYEKGVSVCLVAIPKETAEIICQNITAATGCKVDWHYFGGRVHIKALRVASQPAPVVPDGYVMVPKEPTREILDEFDSIIDYGAEGSVDAWRRLLASAPQEVKGE